jgi:hypothetical protein
MRVCYDNLVESAVVLALTNLQNDSFVEYLYDPYLELACFCTATTAVLTGSWEDAHDITAFAIGYHSAEFARVILKDINGDEIYNQLHTLEDNDSIYYITKVQGVFSFEIQFSSGELIYIGYLFFGEYLELPRFVSLPKFPFQLRSSSSKSLGGQVSGVMATPIRGAAISWRRMSNEKRKELYEYLTAVQTAKAHMIDLYPEAHDQEAPFYAHVTEFEDAEKEVGGWYFNLSIKYEEAR